MPKLNIDSLWSLEEYAKRRPDFRQQVMQHKKNRRVCLGPNATLYFEDEMTMRYQIQEMLRIEKVFEEDGIRDELDAYNPLIPDGSNWKATFMLEYEDPAERQQRVEGLVGIERVVWIQVEGCEKVFAIADEDLDRESRDRTSTVHFLRFELSPNMIEKVKGGAGLAMGIQHDNYYIESVSVSDAVHQSLANDLEGKVTLQ